MGGTRALIASLGASISLVAGAALSLLVVSFIFAYDGLAGASDEPASRSALVVADPSTPRVGADSAPTRASALVIAERRRAAPAPPAAVVVQRLDRPRAVGGEIVAPARRRSSAVPGVSDAGPVAPRPPVKQAEPAPSPGDGVRDLGEAVGGTVDGTGAVADAITPLLGPPVSAAVQDVLDLVTTLLQRTTGRLAGTLDTLKK